jgi:transposase
MINRQPYTPEEIEILINTYTTHSTREQAAIIGRSVASVVQKRCILIKKALVDPKCRKKQRLWTDNERYLIEELIIQGYSINHIAQRLTDRSADAIRGFILYSGRTLREMRSGLFAVRGVCDVARLFGVHPNTVVRWIGKHWLYARRNIGQQKKHRQRYARLITDESIQKFMTVREAWPTWEPAWIHDSDWNREAMDIRKAARGRWIRPRDAAKMLYYSEKTILYWLNRGKWQVTTMKHGKHWYIWLSDTMPLTSPY